MCNRLFDAQTPNHELTDREVRTLESFEPQKILPFVFPKHLYPLAEPRDQASSSLCPDAGDVRRRIPAPLRPYSTSNALGSMMSNIAISSPGRL